MRSLNMGNDYSTDQERFWAGQFGNDYISRNDDAQALASQFKNFSNILARTNGVKSVIEFGANIGLNLQVLKMLLPEVSLSAIEINQKAVKNLKKWAKESVKIYPQSIFDFKIDYKRDLTFTKGVLIHLNPDKLPLAYKLLYDASSHYICIAEYYNPTPTNVEYRGNKDRLFKRDFAGEMMKKYPDLRLVDYGFFYHLDPNFPDDDISWFLLEKKK